MFKIIESVTDNSTSTFKYYNRNRCFIHYFSNLLFYSKKLSFTHSHLTFILFMCSVLTMKNAKYTTRFKKYQNKNAVYLSIPTNCFSNLKMLSWIHKNYFDVFYYLKSFLIKTSWFYPLFYLKWKVDVISFYSFFFIIIIVIQLRAYWKTKAKFLLKHPSVILFCKFKFAELNK